MLDLAGRTVDLVGMAREIDDKKKRKALRKLRKAAERAQAEDGPGLSDWEKEFVEEVEARVEKYGSAFGDPDKGNLDEPLSALQTRKLKEIDKKSRGKGGGFKHKSGFKSSFKSKGKKSFTPRTRDIHSDLEEEATVPEDTATQIKPPVPPRGSKPKLIKASDLLDQEHARAADTQHSGRAPRALKAVPSENSSGKIPTSEQQAPEDAPSPARKKPIFQIIKGGKDR